MSRRSALAAISVQGGNIAGAALQRRKQMPVLDIVCKGRQADLGGIEADLRRAQQPRRIVDQPHALERCRLVRTASPDAKRVERRNRARQQRGRTVVMRSRRHGDHGRLDAGAGERDRRRQARRAAANHHHFGCRMSS